MIKGQSDKALKIFESALNDLKLDSKDGETNLYNGNNDLAALLVNYIKCNQIHNCYSQEFLKTDEKHKILIGYLQKVNVLMFNEMIEERKKAEIEFDEAVKMVQ